MAEVALAGIERFPLILTGILIAVTAATGCGELSLLFGAFCQFVHLFSMYKVRLILSVANEFKKIYNILKVIPCYGINSFSLTLYIRTIWNH